MYVHMDHSLDGESALLSSYFQRKSHKLSSHQCYSYQYVIYCTQRRYRVSKDIYSTPTTSSTATQTTNTNTTTRLPQHYTITTTQTTHQHTTSVTTHTTTSTVVVTCNAWHYATLVRRNPTTMTVLEPSFYDSQLFLMNPVDIYLLSCSR